MKKIYVVGSSNTDMVVRCDRLPKPGETVLGGRFIIVRGGKGRIRRWPPRGWVEM